MYEIINNTFSYPELEKGEISNHAFQNKIIDENYRPLFINKINTNL